MKKLKSSKKNDEKKIKDAVEGIKPLGKPVHGKFLTLMIKNDIINGESKESED